MSQASVSAAPQTQPSSPDPAASASRQPLAKFDARIADVSDKVLPKQPYLITIPSDSPYRRHSTDPNRWYLNTPFSKQEEQLQYMSLLTHQDDDESLLRVDGSRIDEDGHLQAASVSPRSELPSRPETPNEHAPKKKLTLKDYKTKDRSTVNTPERPASADMRKQAIKSHKEEVEAKHSHSLSNPEPRSKINPGSGSPEKEPRASQLSHPKVVPKPSLSTATQRDNESLRPAKKRRLSSENAKPVSVTAHSVVKDVHPEKKALPDLLSPDMPTADAKPKVRGLPQLLSPDLPPSLEKAAASAPLVQRTDEVRAVLKTLGSPVRSNERKAAPSMKDSGNRVRSESQTSAQSITSAIRASSPIAKSISANPSKPGSIFADVRTGSPKPRQRHTVILKYGKKNRKRVEMLLKLAPAHKKDHAPAAQTEASQPTKLAKIPSAKSDKKRPAEGGAETSPTKPKTGTVHDPPKPGRPSTPKAEVSARSPNHAARPKSAFSTPKKDGKDLKAPAMQRVTSTDTTDARTPSQDVQRTSTPMTVSHASQAKMSPGPTVVPSKSDEYTAWTDLNTRIFQLGRVLKKDGSKLASEGEGKIKQQGVILLIEALLCFMLNSAAQAQARPGADPGWSTILPYHIMVYKQSRPYRHLHGLVVQLGAVCRQHLHQEHLKRLAKETLPDDHIGSAPTPGSDGNARAADDPARKQRSFLELRDELVQNAKELKVAWLEGCRLLPYELIEEQYPGTWTRRSKDFGKRHSERLSPKELAKDFYLPLDVSTTVFEATNFALAFLHEWSMIEQVKWKARIEL